MSYTDIKTFEDACEKLGVNPEDFKITYPDVLGVGFGKSLAAHAKLVVIAKALNDGWEPDWSNGYYDKWSLFFWMNNPSAVGRFSFHVYDNYGSYSGVCSRLCYKSKEIAEYAGRQFEYLYREYFVIK